MPSDSSGGLSEGILPRSVIPRSVFWKSLRDQQVAILGWGVGIGALAYFTVLLYPMISEQFQAYDELLKGMPAVTSFLGNVATLGTLEGYITYGLLSYLPLILGIYAVLTAVGMIGGEIESGTMDFLLMHPVPRWRIALEKMAALAIALAAIGLLIGVGMWLGGLAINSELAVGRWLLAGVIVVPLCLFYGALTFALSSLARGRQVVQGIGFGVLMVSFIANGLVPLVKDLEPYREWSLYYLYSASKPLSTGIRVDHAAILVAASLALIVLGTAAFQRRDLLS